MKTYLSTAIGIAFLSVTTNAFAGDAPQAPAAAPQSGNYSDQDLEKIHSSPAKKQSPPAAAPQSGTGTASGNTSERDLEKIHSSPARKEAKPPDTEINRPEVPKSESDAPKSETK